MEEEIMEILTMGTEKSMKPLTKSTKINEKLLDSL
jgi:hypothetical protein